LRHPAPNIDVCRSISPEKPSISRKKCGRNRTEQKLQESARGWSRKKVVATPAKQYREKDDDCLSEADTTHTTFLEALMKVKNGMGGSRNGKGRREPTAVLKKMSKKARREQGKAQSVWAK
jgi:hypothetical protein